MVAERRGCWNSKATDSSPLWIASTCEASGDTAGRTGVATEIDRAKQGVFKTSSLEKAPQRGFEGVDHVAAALEVDDRGRSLPDTAPGLTPRAEVASEG